MRTFKDFVSRNWIPASALIILLVSLYLLNSAK